MKWPKVFLAVLVFVLASVFARGQEMGSSSGTKTFRIQIKDGDYAQLTDNEKKYWTDASPHYAKQTIYFQNGVILQSETAGHKCANLPRIGELFGFSQTNIVWRLVEKDDVNEWLPTYTVQKMGSMAGYPDSIQGDGTIGMSREGNGGWKTGGGQGGGSGGGGLALALGILGGGMGILGIGVVLFSLARILRPQPAVGPGLSKGAKQKGTMGAAGGGKVPAGSGEPKAREADWRKRYTLCSSKDERGGFGHAYTVRRGEWGAKMKLKILREKWISNDLWVEQMRSECAILEYLERRFCQHVPRLVECGGALATPPRGGEAWFVMTMAPGEPLARTMEKLRKAGVERRLSLICALSDALAALHGCRVAHRDLTPENVFVERGWLSGRWRVTLIDFGSSLGPEPGLGIRFPPKYFVGKPRYCPPEQRADMNAASFPADVYALGILAAEILLAGRPARPALLEPIPPDPAEYRVHRRELEAFLVRAGGVAPRLAKFLSHVPIHPRVNERCPAAVVGQQIREMYPHVG